MNLSEAFFEELEKLGARPPRAKPSSLTSKVLKGAAATAAVGTLLAIPVGVAGSRVSKGFAEGLKEDPDRPPSYAR